MDDDDTDNVSYTLWIGEGFLPTVAVAEANDGKGGDILVDGGGGGPIPGAGVDGGGGGANQVAGVDNHGAGAVLDHRNNLRGTGNNSRPASYEKGGWVSWESADPTSDNEATEWEETDDTKSDRELPTTRTNSQANDDEKANELSKLLTDSGDNNPAPESY